MNLPKNWTETTIGDICETTSGGTPDRGREDYYGGDIPWLKSGELEDGRITQAKESISRAGLENSSTKIIPKDTLLIALYGATAGKVGVLKIESAINQAICAITTPPNLRDSFLFYYLIYFRNDLRQKRSGGAQLNLNQGKIQSTTFPLPPQDEQQRIVAKIEELFSKLDSGNESLRTTEKRLNQYQSSTVKSAVTGELTETWRSENQPSVSGADLVERAEEKEEKNKYKKQGKLNDISEDHVFEVPRSWGWARVGDICRKIRYGSSEKADYDFEGVPLLRMGNIQNGKLNFDDLKYLPTDWEREDLMLTNGDVLFNRTNSAELVGKTALYKENHPRSTFASYLVRARVYPDIYNPDLLVYFTNSVFGRQYINSVISQQVGQANVNATKFASMPIPVPSIEEQSQIVREIDHRLSIVDEVANEVECNLKRSSRLRQSILKQAFEGKLVPQGRTEEPPTPDGGNTNLEQGAQTTLWEVTSDGE